MCGCCCIVGVGVVLVVVALVFVVAFAGPWLLGVRLWLLLPLAVSYRLLALYWIMNELYIFVSYKSNKCAIWKYWFCLFVPIYCARCCIECYSEDLVILSGENNLFWGEKEVAHYWCCCKLHLTAEHPTAPPSPPRCITTWDAAQMAWCHFEMHLCWFSVLKLPLLETLCSV